MIDDKIRAGLHFGELAMITDIQRYSVHDGPGIRTIVFFKGCPLRCKWCHNPETFSLMPEIIYEKSDCIGCGRCIEVCTAHAVSLKDGALITDREKCTNCGECALVCPSKARRMVGDILTIEDVIGRVKRDRVFYKNSGGGVTLSGGEVTMQSIFAQKLLLKLKGMSIHTAIETCAYASPENFRRVAFAADLILFDFKHPDPEKHRQYTGVDNVLIHQNLLDAIAAGKKVIARYPLIPGVNDSMQDVEATGAFCKSAGIEEIHLLPFHQNGETKWVGLDKDYSFKGQEGMSVVAATKAASRLKDLCLKVCVGGSGT